MGLLPSPLLRFWEFHTGTHSACGGGALEQLQDVRCISLIPLLSLPFFLQLPFISFPFFLLFVFHFSSLGVSVTPTGIHGHHLTLLVVPCMFFGVDILHVERWLFSSLKQQQRDWMQEAVVPQVLSVVIKFDIFAWKFSCFEWLYLRTYIKAQIRFSTVVSW